jgi:hypothetical protein
MSKEETTKKQEKQARRKRIKKAIARTAPELARALGGPLAGAAIGAIANAVLGDETGEEALIEQAVLSGNPDVLLQLEEAELAFNKALWEAQNRAEAIAAGDRDSARQRQVAIRDWTPSVLGVAVILGFFIVLGTMLSSNLPEGAENEFAIMLGALATMTAAVVNYFFGSSAGSKEKTKLLLGKPENSAN